MKLPIIKHLTTFIEENDQDYVLEAIETLESITEVSSLKDEELDVIGELKFMVMMQITKMKTLEPP